MADVMKLQLDTGAVTVEMEDESGRALGSFSFQPADSNLLKRYGAVVEHFNAIKLEQTEDEQRQAEQMSRLCDDIGQQFDYLLGGDVAKEIFAKCGPLTVTKNGDFFFEQVLEGVGALVEKVTKKRLDKKLARIRKTVANAPSVKNGRP